MTEKYLDEENTPKIHKGMTLLGGLVGLVVTTLAFVLLSLFDVFHGRFTILALLPFAFISFFSTLGNAQTSTKSKFSVREAKMDKFGFFVGVVASYLAIYLSEVLYLTRLIIEQNSHLNYFDLFQDFLINILWLDWANEYLLKYWAFLTVIYVLGLVVYVFNRFKKGFSKAKNDDDIE